uniref:Uncharacterized protein n=1 Tax=Photinus pyralis TaxID=7054 RepID=A0A1Y1LMB7_PHOPY
MANALCTVLAAIAVYQVLSLPMNENIKLPRVGTSNPYEINGLNYAHQKSVINNASALENSLDYVDKTVRQVQEILKANSSLPRLTRGEILEIIEKLTKSDLAAAQREKSKQRDQKSVMLVMPYTPNRDDDGKMQELYTKAPVTQIVNDSKPGNARPTSREKVQVKQRGVQSTTATPKVKTSSSADFNHQSPKVKEEPYLGRTTAEVRPDSYIKFKPLPEISGVDEEMEEFLGRFGLGKSAQSGRKNRKIHTPRDTLSEIPGVDFEIVPDTLQDVVKNLGLWNREGKDFEHHVSPPQTHVFNPIESTYATQEELDKLNQLMELIKQLEKLNGTASEADLNKLDMDQLKELVGSLQKNDSGLLGADDDDLNPINYDIGLSKNEVKRQENSTSTEATSAATSNQETETVNIKDLEDSFGGSAAIEAEVTVPPPTEAPKTGFYYLLDWNSFFDIDDQKGKRVNLRFQPKVGDPRQFISVSVP